MNRYRNAPGLRGPTKATASTLCQKCLKRGHYSYECKSTAQDRPYVSRPSRTQQLQNPDLVPKLKNETMVDMTTRTTGLADEIIAKQEQERGSKRDLDDEEYGQSSKRLRSLSSRSSISVSTISTDRSRSGSPEYRTRYSRPRDEEQGRGSSLTNKSRQRKRRYSDESASDSSASVEQPRRSRDVSPDHAERNTRRKRREYSPPERGRKRDSSTARGSHRYQSQSQSQERSRIARERRSMTPKTQQRRRSPHPSDRAAQRGGEPQRSLRDRSLSPFSKRLALTQAMNMGR